LSSSVTINNISNYNFRFIQGSPCLAAGTDGADLGIYGGAFPMRNLTGVSSLPYLQYVRLANPVVEKNGTLKVKVKAYSYE
jgi:hypothetical protein